MRVKLVKIIKKLSSKSEEKRKEAMQELADLKLDEINLEHLEYVIQSTATVYRDEQHHLEDASGALMEFVARYDVTELIPALTEYFPAMSIWARSIVLTLLTRTQSTESIQTLLDLLDQYIDKLPFTDFQIELMGTETDCIHMLFPKILDYLDYPSISYTVNRFVWLCLSKGTLQKEDIEAQASVFLREYRLLKETLIAYQQKFTPAVKWSHAYQELRNLAGLFLDIFGFLPLQEVEEELQEAIQFKDNRLRYFAASSLLRLGQTIDKQLIEDLAADHETRNFVYYMLLEYDQEVLYPIKYKSQEFFATSEFVSWLIYPTELGHEPTEIECMDVITRYDEDLGAVNYYVFRFRSDHDLWEEAGWLAGVAGFYIKDQEPTLLAHGYTFSLFEGWEFKSSEEHLDSVFEVLHQLWENEVE